MTAYLVRMLSPSQYWVTPVLIVLLAIVPLVAFAKDNTVSAYEFVQEWIKTYGINHERAAEMMTIHHRGGMSKAEWVTTYASYIEHVKYKHLGGQLISVQEEEHKAKVILKSSVDSIRGPIVQYEIYDLLKIDGDWLIDFIDIKDENFGAAIGPETTEKLNSKSNNPAPKHVPSQ